MCPRTPPAELARNMPRVCDKPRWFEDRAERASHAARPASHAELAHVRSHLHNVFLGLKLDHLPHGPAGGHPGMSVKKVASAGSLVIIDFNTTLNISFSLRNAFFELSFPGRIVLVHELV